VLEDVYREHAIEMVVGEREPLPTVTDADLDLGITLGDSTAIGGRSSTAT
jgi:hypothetical protein